MAVVRAIRGFWRRKGPASGRDALVLGGACLGGFAVLALLLLVMGWVEGAGQITITYENQTSGDVTILVDRSVWGSVGAKDAKTVVDMRSSWHKKRSVEVVDQASGRLLFSAALDFDDLKLMNNRILITERPGGY